jgi:thioesterase domain-containing protein
MAQQLLQQGHEVALLAIIEPQHPKSATLGAYTRFALDTAHRALRRLRHQGRQLAQVEAAEQGTYLRLKARVIANRWASVRYTPAPYPGQLQLFLSADSLQKTDNPQLNWLKLATGGAELHQLPGTHDTITGNNGVKIEAAHMQALAEHLNRYLRQVSSL